MFFLKDRRRHMRTVWGHTFEWTTEHQTKDQMRPLTFTYDALASECLDRLDDLSTPSTNPLYPDMKESRLGVAPRSDSLAPHPRRDLYALLEQHHASDAKLEELWTQVHTVPSWVDWDQIRRGQDVLYRYGGPSVVSLTFQSLVGGMAGWRVVETLTRTGGFGVRVAKHRLLETFQHILQVTKDLDSVRPGGEGFVSSIRVRLLHASVRRRIMALARKKPGYFDVAEWGMPLNDLDCIGTVLSFSSALVWLGLPRQGIYLREQEIVDYHALWRWVGYLLGTPTDPWLAGWQQSKFMFESLIVAELLPSETSKVLANNVLTGLSHQPPGVRQSGFLMRRGTLVEWD
ncbi:hypothetical protein OPQ81_005371 [Rhizoctonia solani]|nr:hypothetical protein OPQ81_005371 [Rhizoctonia solani]